MHAKFFPVAVLSFKFIFLSFTSAALGHESASSLEHIRQRALLWQYGWLGFFSGSILLQASTIANKKSTDAEKFDARLALVTSGSGALSVLLNPLPTARWDYSTLSSEELDQILRNADTEAMRRRSLEFQALIIAEQLLVAGAIAFADNRPKDALRRFALGMLVSEAFIFTTPLTGRDSSDIKVGLSSDSNGAKIEVVKLF